MQKKGNFYKSWRRRAFFSPRRRFTTYIFAREKLDFRVEEDRFERSARMKQNLFNNFTDFIDSAVARGARFCPDWATYDDDDFEAERRAPVATLEETHRDAQEFAEALEKFRLVHRRRAVSYEEALSVLKSLGYRKD